MGPAGSGKSTYCATALQYYQNAKRNVHLMNLDPAAEKFEYNPSIEDVMEEMGYGPNGGLIYCFEFLMESLDWLEEQIGDFDDDYLIIDCPGQIELYTHFPLMRQFCYALQNTFKFNIVGVYCLESQFIEDTTKYFAGVMSATSAMFNLEIPQINVMTKMDLVSPDLKKSLDRYFDPDKSLLLSEANKQTPPKFLSLNNAISSIIDEFSMVSFIPLDISDEDSIAYVISHADNSIQFGEDEEPKEPK
ncbi:GPN-loop GTPase 3, partial [Smittium culicis]